MQLKLVYIVYMDAMITDIPLQLSHYAVQTARDVMVEHYPEYDYLPEYDNMYNVLWTQRYACPLCTFYVQCYSI